MSAHADPDSHTERGRCRSGVTRDDRHTFSDRAAPQPAAKSGHCAPRVEIVIYDIELDLDDPALMRAKVCALMAEHTEIPPAGLRLQQVAQRLAPPDRCAARPSRDGHGFVRRPADRLISE